MFNCLKMTLKIDIAYAINAFLYTLRTLPIFKDLLTEDIYKSKSIKNILTILSLFLSILRLLTFRFFYFLLIYELSKFLSPKSISETFIHLYFIFTIIGLFINNGLLNTSIKKYLSIILFNMNAKKYLQSNLLLRLFLSFILNSIFFILFSKFLNLSYLICLLLVLFSLTARIIGESLNIMYYKKFNYIWYNNTSLYLLVLGVFLGLTLLPLIKITTSNSIIILSTIISLPLSIISLIYLNKINDYRLIFKRLNNKNTVMNKENAKAYSRQAMFEVKEKDKNISAKKLKGKKGYDLFNTIFFERHKEILSRSSKNYALVIGIIYIVIVSLVLSNIVNIEKSISNFLLNRIGWFVIIMYFINRGAIITQAMFFNCDHSMLTYNFYKEPKVLLNLFKKRLVTLIKVNLLPAIVIAFGNTILLSIVTDATILEYLTSSMFIIVLSIFFSVHYLVIYYLLQPFNKDMEIKKPSYSIVSLITYIASYKISGITTSTITFSIIGSILTIIYMVVALILVYKKAPQTFKLN